MSDIVFDQWSIGSSPTNYNNKALYTLVIDPHPPSLLSVGNRCWDCAVDTLLLLLPHSDIREKYFVCLN